MPLQRQVLRALENKMKSLNPNVNLIKIPVTDFKRAQTFYRDVLGLEEEFTPDENSFKICQRN